VNRNDPPCGGAFILKRRGGAEKKKNNESSIYLNKRLPQRENAGVGLASSGSTLPSLLTALLRRGSGGGSAQKAREAASEKCSPDPDRKRYKRGQRGGPSVRSQASAGLADRRSCFNLGKFLEKGRSLWGGKVLVSTSLYQQIYTSVSCRVILRASSPKRRGKRDSQGRRSSSAKEKVQLSMPAREKGQPNPEGKRWNEVCGAQVGLGKSGPAWFFSGRLARKDSGARSASLKVTSGLAQEKGRSSECKPLKGRSSGLPSF